MLDLFVDWGYYYERNLYNVFELIFFYMGIDIENCSYIFVCIVLCEFVLFMWVFGKNIFFFVKCNKTLGV